MAALASHNSSDSSGGSGSGSNNNDNKDAAAPSNAAAARTGSHGATGGVDVERDIAVRVCAVQVQQLRHNEVGHVIVHRAA